MNSSPNAGDIGVQVPVDLAHKIQDWMTVSLPLSQAPLAFDDPGEHFQGGIQHDARLNPVSWHSGFYGFQDDCVRSIPV